MKKAIGSLILQFLLFVVQLLFDIS